MMDTAPSTEMLAVHLDLHLDPSGVLRVSLGEPGRVRAEGWLAADVVLAWWADMRPLRDALDVERQLVLAGALNSGAPVGGVVVPSLPGDLEAQTGRVLGEVLRPDAVFGAWQRVQSAAQSSDRVLLLLVSVVGHPDPAGQGPDRAALCALPWELLRPPESPAILETSKLGFVVRLLDGASRPRLAQRRSLEIHHLVAAPDDPECLGLDAAARDIYQGLGPAVPCLDLRVETPSLQGENFRVLVVITHGHETLRGLQLLIDGVPAPTSEGLRQLPPLSAYDLVLVCVCFGAVPGVKDNPALPELLLSAGARVVVAAQLALPVDHALALIRTLMAALVRGEQLGTALVRCRSLIQSNEPWLFHRWWNLRAHCVCADALSVRSGAVDPHEEILDTTHEEEARELADFYVAHRLKRPAATSPARVSALHRRLRSGGTPRAGDVLGRRYQLDQCLGEGRLHQTWLAMDLYEPDRTRVALKILRPRLAENTSARTAFCEAAALMARIDKGEPSGSVLDSAQEDDPFLFYPVRYYRQIVRSALDLQGQRAYQRRVLVLRLLQIVARMHSHGISRLGLTMSNVYLFLRDEAQLSVRVGDYGYAPMRRGAVEVMEPSGPCLAPEARSIRTPLDPRVDVYAAGVLALLLLTGYEVDTSKSKDLKAALAMIESDDRRRVIRRAVERDPAKRFPDGRALLDAWVACPEAKDSVHGRARPIIGKRWAGLLIVVLVLGVLALFGPWDGAARLAVDVVLDRCDARMITTDDVQRITVTCSR